MAELSSGCLARSYTWGPDLSGSLQGAGGIGGLVFVRDSGNSYYPAYDGNGNLTAMVLANSGAAVAKYEYSPYGELLTSTGTYASTNPFRFSTKYVDSETNLAYFGYRYYNPETGRWINRDPIEEEGGKNLYGYVRNDPVLLTDSLGLISFPKIGWPWVVSWLENLLALKMMADFNFAEDMNQVLGPTECPCGKSLFTVIMDFETFSSTATATLEPLGLSMTAFKNISKTTFTNACCKSVGRWGYQRKKETVTNFSTTGDDPVFDAIWNVTGFMIQGGYTYSRSCN
jgi:RHS repeat-associated protein